jgi:GT2 family glycosyltransferase
VLLADDGSTDPEVAGLLAAATARPNVTVSRSGSNRGFVATVNAAMAATRGNAVILNSDTEVPPAWIDRLLRPIAEGGSIAATAPFSNAAQIFSVPTPDHDHDLPLGVGTVEIDQAFARLQPSTADDLESPTTIGFCMAISRRAWNALGPFDADAFGRGYCEETDWCLRARAGGWSIRLVPNLFVFHKHGGSFADRERKALLEANLATLHRRWPHYYGELARFRRRDPWAVYRAAALLSLATDPDRPRDAGLIALDGKEPTRMAIRIGHWSIELLAGSEAEVTRLQSTRDPGSVV